MIISHPFQEKDIVNWDHNDWADFWYYKVGVNVIPYNGEKKYTWIQWTNHPIGNFQKTSIPEELFNDWKKSDWFSKGIAIICGPVFRGPHVYEYLNGLDLDNIIAICKMFPTKPIEEYAQENLIEQHDNREKCHTYFYTKDRPITSKIANADRNEGETTATKPQIEVKSNGAAIMNCTPSPHKDGSNLSILGTTEIKTVAAAALEKQIEDICKQYGIPYLSQKTDGSKVLPPVQSLIDSNKKILAGEDRQFTLLRYIDSKKIKNPELEYEVLLALAIEFGKKHFAEQYPQSKIEQIVKEAYNFGTKKLLEKAEKEKARREIREKSNHIVKLETNNSKTDSQDLPDIPNQILYFHSINGNKTTSKEVLNYKIRTLRPITYFRKENTKMILVYLPTKKIVEKTKPVGDDVEVVSTEIQWVNSAYFLISKSDSFGVKTREILPFDDESLKENYRINILPEWNDVRWDIKDCKNWLQESNTVDPKELYSVLDKTVRTYLEYDETEYVKFNLWGVATYFYDLFAAFPYYDFTGTKRAGKTKSLEFQNHICYNAIMSPDVTGSSLFRIIEGIGATVLLDESEEFKNKKNDQAQTVRNLLMQAFLKNQYAIRSEATKDKSFTPTQYNIYSPKALAHINAFDDVLEDRCLRHTMKRGLNEAIKNTWVSEKDPAFQKIRNKCYRLFLDHADEIYDLQQEAVTTLGISGRELQLWTPIMTMALFFEKFGVDGLVETILINMKKSKENRQLTDEEESRDLKVLDFLSRFGVDLALNDKNDKAKNPPGWIPVGSLYNSFRPIMFDTYQILPDYFTRRTLSQTLDRFGFTKERKQDGISFLITENTVNEAKKRMGMSDNQDYDGTPKNASDTSDTSDSRLNTSQQSKNENFRNQNQSSETSESSTESSESSTESSDDKSKSSRISGFSEQNEQTEVNIVNQHNIPSKQNTVTPIPAFTPTDEDNSIPREDSGLFTHWACTVCHLDDPELFEMEKLDRKNTGVDGHKRAGHKVKLFTKEDAMEFL